MMQRHRLQFASAQNLSLTLLASRSFLAVSSLCTAMLLYSASSLSVESSPVSELQVIDSPITTLKTNRIFGWRVDSSTSTGDKATANSVDITLIQHNKLSILAHAKSVSSGKIISIQYPSEQEVTNASFRLVGNLPSTPQEATDMQQGIAILPEVSHIRYQLSVKPTFIPTDSCFQFQPELHSMQSTLYNSAVDLVGAWDLDNGQGSPDVAIGVLDSGIVKHTDHDTGRISLGAVQDFVSSPVQSGDGDGRDSDPQDPGFSSTCQPSGYHGTHVTGTIGANSHNAKGITGVNWHSQIIPLRVLGPVDGSSGDIVDAVRWIQENPKVRVLNMSLGLASVSCSQAFFWKPSFLTEAFNKNILSVVAAGNSHSDAGDFSPANCASAIAVAATNEQGRKAYYSNYGLEIDISAPGGEFGKNGNQQHGILSTVNANRYDYKQGTSMATPIVAGIASLVFSRNSALTATEVVNTLKATATAFSTVGSHGVICDTEICGAGIVNAKAAVQHATAVEPPIVFFPRQTQHGILNNSVNVDVLLSKKTATPSAFTVSISSTSCTPTTTEYQKIIAAGSLKLSLAIQESNCQDLRLELKVPANSPLSLSTSNDKHINELIFIDPANIQTETKFEEIHWTYLEPNSQGNIHSVFLKEPSTYYISVISDMNTELIITNAQAEVLFDSRVQDPNDKNKLDYWLKYSLTRAQSLRFTVRERFPGSGGIYAVSLTTAPDFSGEVASYCHVPLGIDNLDCSPKPVTVSDKKTESSTTNYKKTASINIYFLIAMFFLMGLAIAIRLRSLRRN